MPVIYFRYDQDTRQYVLTANWKGQCHFGHTCHALRSIRGDEVVCKKNGLSHDCEFNVRKGVDTIRFTPCNRGKNNTAPCQNIWCPHSHQGDVVSVVWDMVPQRAIGLWVKKRNAPQEAPDVYVALNYDKFDSWYFEKRRSIADILNESIRNVKVKHVAMCCSVTDDESTDSSEGTM
jgi:hypothetical protein